MKFVTDEVNKSYCKVKYTIDSFKGISMLFWELH
jgi:hypothetical protein